jgi:hypothetical protein
MSDNLPVQKELHNEVARILKIDNLTVSPLPQMRINCGDASSFIKMVENTPQIIGCMWSEEKISLILSDRATLVQFYPEINSTTSMFLQRKEHRRDENNKNVVWEGEFEPIQFTKANLIKFLKNQKTSLPEDVMFAIKNLQVIEKKAHESEMLSLDNDDSRTVIEETTNTNIPKHFSMELPVSENYIGKFDFEVGVVTLKDKYDNDTNKKGLVLRCLNARNVLRDMMQQITSKLPKNIPLYYGALSLESNDKNKW